MTDEGRTLARGATKCLIARIDKGGGVLIGADRNPIHLLISRSLSRHCDEPGGVPLGADSQSKLSRRVS
jgi:hypothetical protein